MRYVTCRDVHPHTTGAESERACLMLALQATSLHAAARIAAELRTVGADAVGVHPSRPAPSGRREWTVQVTTPPLPLTVAVIQEWEGAMLAVEHRWPDCHFLGWRTCRAPDEPIGSEREPDHTAAGARQRQSQRELVRSQRELVLASLLRHPARGGGADALNGPPRLR